MSQEEERSPWRARLSRKPEHIRLHQPVKPKISVEFFYCSLPRSSAWVAHASRVLVLTSRRDSLCSARPSHAPCLTNHSALHAPKSELKESRFTEIKPLLIVHPNVKGEEAGASSRKGNFGYHSTGHFSDCCSSDRGRRVPVHPAASFGEPAQTIRARIQAGRGSIRRSA